MQIQMSSFTQLQQRHKKQVNRWEFDSVMRLPGEEAVLYYLKSSEVLSFYYATQAK